MTQLWFRARVKPSLIGCEKSFLLWAGPLHSVPPKIKLQRMTRILGKLVSTYVRFSGRSLHSADSSGLTRIDLAFVERTRFDYCSLAKEPDAEGRTGVEWDSCFSGEINNLSGGATASGRVLSIAKEIGTMSQNLPAAWDSSVFVR